MSKKAFQNTLDPRTIIEVVATRGDQVVIKKVKYQEALAMKKARGWSYKNYQVGFCSMKESN